MVFDANSRVFFTERKALKKELDDLYLDRAAGAQVRSKVKWVEEGERSTSYFLAVEKQRQSGNSIKALKENGEMYTDDKDILRIAKDYCTELYSS